MEVFDFAEVEPIAGVDLNGTDSVLGGGLEIEVDDAIALEGQRGEQSGIEDVYSVESHFFIIVFGTVDPFVLVFLELFPSDQQVLVVEEQLARGCPILRKKPSVIVGVHESIVIVAKGNVTEDIDIVDEDRGGVVEERQCLDDAASGIHQHAALIGEEEVRIEWMGLDELDDLVTEMVDVDDDGVEAVLDETLNIMLQQGLAFDFHQGFGLVFGHLLEAGSQSCCEKHGGSIHGCVVRYGWFSR